MLDRGYGNRRRWVSAVITPPYLVGHVMPISVTTRLNRDECAGLSLNVRREPMTRPSTSRYSPELRERAVRLFLDHAADHPSEWAALRSVGGKLGCRVDALWRWFRQSAGDAGLRADSTTGEQRR